MQMRHSRWSMKITYRFKTPHRGASKKIELPSICGTGAGIGAANWPCLKLRMAWSRRSCTPLQQYLIKFCIVVGITHGCSRINSWKPFWVLKLMDSRRGKELHPFNKPTWWFFLANLPLEHTPNPHRWNIPQTLIQHFIKEFLLSFHLWMPGVCLGYAKQGYVEVLLDSLGFPRQKGMAKIKVFTRRCFFWTWMIQVNDRVDGRNPANHLGCIKSCNGIFTIISTDAGFFHQQHHNAPIGRKPNRVTLPKTNMTSWKIPHLKREIHLQMVEILQLARLVFFGGLVGGKHHHGDSSSHWWLHNHPKLTWAPWLFFRCNMFPKKRAVVFTKHWKKRFQHCDFTIKKIF